MTPLRNSQPIPEPPIGGKLNLYARPNMLRGVVWGVVLSVVGFGIAPAIRFGWGYFRHRVWADVRWSMDDELFWLRETLPSLLAVGWVFGWAGIINFLPAYRMGLVRAIGWAGVVTIASMVVVRMMLDVGPPPKSHAHFHPNLIAACLLTMALSGLACCYLTFRQMRGGGPGVRSKQSAVRT